MALRVPAVAASAPSAATAPQSTFLGFQNQKQANSLLILRQRGKLLTRRLALIDEQKEQFSFTKEENSLIDALIGIQGRGHSASPQQLTDVERAVQALEGLQGVPDPTISSLIEGRWQLMFTRPGSASPIQVEASIKDGKRILFQFDRAAFSFKFLPFKVPYPVPLRVLGDEAKGWLDTTYLSQSGNLRVSRGNKGTTFVLRKKTEPRQKLFSAMSTDTRVLEAINAFISLCQKKGKGEAELEEGEWQMLWSSKMETDSWLENAANGLMGKQIVKNGRIKFVVDIFLGLKFSMVCTFVKSSTNTHDITMDDAALIGGGFGYPLKLESKFDLDELYSDGKIRITHGYNKIVLVHVRTYGSKQK